MKIDKQYFKDTKSFVLSGAIYQNGLTLKITSLESCTSSKFYKLDDIAYYVYAVERPYHKTSFTSSPSHNNTDMFEYVFALKDDRYISTCVLFGENDWQIRHCFAYASNDLEKLLCQGYISTDLSETIGTNMIQKSVYTAVPAMV